MIHAQLGTCSDKDELSNQLIFALSISHAEVCSEVVNQFNWEYTARGFLDAYCRAVQFQCDLQLCAIRCRLAEI